MRYSEHSYLMPSRSGRSLKLQTPNTCGARRRPAGIVALGTARQRIEPRHAHENRFTTEQPAQLLRY
jgi:hypothetical protein